MKNIHILSINMMLNTTQHWLADEEFRAVLEKAGPLGVGVLAELSEAHEPLAELESKRSQAQTMLRTLIDAAGVLDGVHDRKARALHSLLRGLAEGTDDPNEARAWRELEGLLFPAGLRVVRLSYIEEGGAAVALERGVSAEVRAKLAATPVGSQTLDDVFSAWMTAGIKLGGVVERRAELRASLARDGSAVGDIDLKAGRTRWVKAVRGLLWAIDIRPKELGGISERVHAALDEGIAIRLRGRDEGDGGEEVLAVIEEGQAIEEGDAVEDDPGFDEDDEGAVELEAELEADEG